MDAHGLAHVAAKIVAGAEVVAAAVADVTDPGTETETAAAAVVVAAAVDVAEIAGTDRKIERVDIKTKDLCF